MFIPIIAFLFWACEDSVNSTTSTGTITGTVKLSQATNNDYSGVEVLLNGPPYSTTSHTDGTWELSNVPAGVYKLDFNKLGYFTQTIYNFQFVGSGTYYFYTLTLPKIPSERVTQLDVQVIDTNSIYFSGLISPPTESRQAVVLLLSTLRINRTAPIEAYNSLILGVNANQYEYGLDYYPIWDESVSSGDTLYAVAFLSDDNHIGLSYNPINNSYVYNTPGGAAFLSNVVSVVVP